MSAQPQRSAAPPPFDALDPYPWFAWMRQHERVYQDATSSIWYLFGYQEVLQALNPPLRPTPQDPIFFSSAISAPADGERSMTQGSIILTDPPRQRAVRELLNAAFSPRILQDRYAPWITAIIDEVIDQIIDAQEADIVPLAYAIPVLVITELLGVPRSDRPKFQDWARQSVGLQVEGDSVLTRIPEMEQYFLQAIDQRRQRAKGEPSDLITILAHGCPHDGVVLNRDELVGNCELLLLAGFETTAHLLTNLFRVLDAFPEVQQQVWHNPGLVPALIEETLRYLSPLHFQLRRTAREVEIGGEIIPANQMVFPLLSSANRDEQVFAHAESFELMRFVQAAPTHVSFGFRGAHFCLGAPLARLEANLMMQRLIARMEHLRVVTGTTLKPIPASAGIIAGVNGVQSLPVTFRRR